MIKYLDKITFPSSYKITDLSGRSYRSIDEWIISFKKKLKNKHTKKKYKHFTPFLYINNTAPREDIEKYLYDKLSEETLGVLMKNSDRIMLELSWDFSEIIFITFSYGLNDIYIDPKVYYDGFRLDCSKAYTTSYCCYRDYGPCKAYVSHYLEYNTIDIGCNFSVSYQLVWFSKGKDNEDGILFEPHETSPNCFGAIPVYHIKEYSQSNRDSIFDRYKIIFDSINHEYYTYVDAISEDAALRIFYNEECLIPCGVEIKEIIKLPDGQWF